jgi:hypothetical protein
MGMDMIWPAWIRTSTQQSQRVRATICSNLQQSQEGTSTAWHLFPAKSTHPFDDGKLHHAPPMIFPSE